MKKINFTNTLGASRTLGFFFSGKYQDDGSTSQIFILFRIRGNYDGS